MRYINRTENEVRRMEFFENLKGFYKWVIFVIWLFLWFIVFMGIHNIAVDSHLYQNSVVEIYGSALGGLILTYPFNVFRQDSMTVIALELSFMWTGSIILVVLSAIASCFSVIFPEFPSKNKIFF